MLNKSKMNVSYGYKSFFEENGPGCNAVLGISGGKDSSIATALCVDGLCRKTDENNLGFTYDELDKYIHTGVIEDQKKKPRIDNMHKMNLFKLQLMPSFMPNK